MKYRKKPVVIEAFATEEPMDIYGDEYLYYYYYLTENIR